MSWIDELSEFFLFDDRSPQALRPGMEISRKWEISRIFPGIQEKIDQANRNTKGSVSAVLVIVKL